MTGAGLWMPGARELALLRQDIDQNSSQLKSVLRNAGLRKEFFNGIPDDERKAVKAFASQNQESALKTKPKVSEIILRSPFSIEWVQYFNSLACSLKPP